MKVFAENANSSTKRDVEQEMQRIHAVLVVHKGSIWLWQMPFPLAVS